MIGKKSKFQEHERVKVQDNKDFSNSSTDGMGEGTKKKTSSSNKSQENNISNRNEDKSVKVEDSDKLLSDYTRREICEEEIAQAQEEAEFYGEESTNSRSRKRVEEHKALSGNPNIIVPQNIKSDTDLLWDDICNGVNGKNSGIPMGFNRLNKYLGLRKSIFTLIGSQAGCGKTSLVDCAYVLNPYDWYIRNKFTSQAKFEVIYFSMERKKTYKLSKWLCMKIWKEENILMTTDELLSWQTKLDSRKQEIAKFYIDNYFKEMMESGIIKIIDGPQNPTGCYKFMYSNALNKGHEEQVSQWESRYVPDNDNLITNVVIDHIGKSLPL